MHPPDLHFEVQMHPRASILRSRWRPGGPSETPRAYFEGLGGDVGAPGVLLETLGEHVGALGAASGLCGSAPGTIWGTLWVVFGRVVLSILFVRVGRQNLTLCWSFSNLVFMFFPEFPKMAEIVPNREILMNLQHFVSRSSFRISLEPWQNGVGKGMNVR